MRFRVEGLKIVEFSGFRFQSLESWFESTSHLQFVKTPWEFVCPLKHVFSAMGLDADITLNSGS